MTWLSFAARSGSLLLVTPLVLTRFTAAEILLWFFFLTIGSLQLMADFGFGPSFVRAIAYARAGRSQLDSEERIGNEPNIALLACISRVLHRAYRYLTAAGILLAVLLGSWATAKPVGQLADAREGWVAWGFVVVCNAVVFRNSAYGVWLQGMNQVARFRRIETVLALLSTSAAALAIIFSGKFLVAVVVAQVAAMLGSFAIRQMTPRLASIPAPTRGDVAEDGNVFRFIWPAAWRSGVGVLMSTAIIQASGLVYAQFGEARQVASYLFAMRIMQMLIQISMAPFYSKIPWFASLYGGGMRRELIPAARRAMAQCHWIFAVGVVGVVLSMDSLLGILGSRVEFVPAPLWMTMGLAFMIERIGAMHIQFYSLSNHILWHIANGISGTIYLVVSAILLPQIGSYAFPIGMMIAYAGFYTWFAARLVYRHYQINAFQFEAGSSASPAGLIIVALLLVSLKRH